MTDLAVTNGGTSQGVLDVLVNHSAQQHPVSGQWLAQKLGVSRVAIWKAIENLRQLGYVIEAVHGGGYRLMPRPDGLLPGEIQYGLNTIQLGRVIEYQEEVNSTNVWASEWARMGATHGSLAIAAHQLEGRGRRGRSWQSPSGGLYMSFVMRPDMAMVQLPLWTLAVALATAKALESASPLLPPVQIKWPNDLIIGRRKIGGILCEATGHPDRVDWVVAGIGINVNTTPALDTATSLSALHTPAPLRIVAQRIIQNMEHTLPNEWSLDVAAKIAASWTDRAVGIDQPATITSSTRDTPPKVIAEGIFRGIDETTGSALIELPSGRIHLFPAGDIRFHPYGLSDQQDGW